MIYYVFTLLVYEHVIMQNHCLNIMPGPLYFSALLLAVYCYYFVMLLGKFFLKFVQQRKTHA